MRNLVEKLSAELRELERELRVELPKDIRTAVAMGDLSENAEYKAALERQHYVRARIGLLRERLSELSTLNVNRIPRDRVGLGSSVTLEDLDSGAEVEYELVVPELADAEEGLISTSSPIGKGLLGRREGERVTIEIPSGTRRFEILALRTLHDKAAEEGPAGGLGR